MPKSVPPTRVIRKEQNRTVATFFYFTNNFYVRKVTVNHYPGKLFKYRVDDEVMFCFYNHLFQSKKIYKRTKNINWQSKTVKASLFLILIFNHCNPM